VSMWAATMAVLYAFVQWYYLQYVPANNPSWRKMMNKEWDEAINNSPWDHMSHVYQYVDIYACNGGDLITRGSKKFYIPA